MRLNTPKVPKRPDANDPNQDALGMFNSGMRAGADGTLQPTQDYGGLLRKASQGVNSLTRGVRGGQTSSLGKPLNSMYEQNPGFFNRGGNAGGVEGFGQMLAQRGQMPDQGESRDQRIAQAKESGQFDSIRGAFNEKAKSFGQMMDETGKISTLAPYRPGLSAPTVQSQTQNRAGLQDAVTAKKLLAEAGGAPKVTTPTISTPAGDVPMTGAKNIEGKYGSGFSAPTKGPKTEGMVNGRPFSEVMQGLANKPGLARKGDKFQPQQWSDVLKRAKTK